MDDTRNQIGPIHRAASACYACGAAPGQRHGATCDLRPGAPWPFPVPDQFGPYVPPCEWCGQPGGDLELGPIVNGQHAGCSTTAAARGY